MQIQTEFCVKSTSLLSALLLENGLPVCPLKGTARRHVLLTCAHASEDVAENCIESSSFQVLEPQLGNFASNDELLQQSANYQLLLSSRVKPIKETMAYVVQV